MKTTNEALAARLDLLSLALQEVCRAIAPAQAAQVASGIQEHVAGMLGARMAPAIDEVIAGDLAQLLGALRPGGATNLGNR